MTFKHLFMTTALLMFLSQHALADDCPLSPGVDLMSVGSDSDGPWSPSISRSPTFSRHQGAASPSYSGKSPHQSKHFSFTSPSTRSVSRLTRAAVLSPSQTLERGGNVLEALASPYRKVSRIFPNHKRDKSFDLTLRKKVKPLGISLAFGQLFGSMKTDINRFLFFTGKRMLITLNNVSYYAQISHEHSKALQDLTDNGKSREQFLSMIVNGYIFMKTSSQGVYGDKSLQIQYNLVKQGEIQEMNGIDEQLKKLDFSDATLTLTRLNMGLYID